MLYHNALAEIYMYGIFILNSCENKFMPVDCIYTSTYTSTQASPFKSLFANLNVYL